MKILFARGSGCGRRLLTAMFALFLVLQIGGAAIAAERPIIAYCEDCVPFHFRGDDGEPAGMIIDLWRLWSEKTGVDVEFRVAPWDETLRMVRDGDADIHAGLFHSASRAQFLEYGVRLTSTDTHYFTKKGLPPLSGVDGLAAYRVGVLSGDFVEEFLNERLPEGTTIGFASYEAMMEALRSGEVRAFAADTPTGIFHLQRAGLGFEFEFPADRPLYRNDWLVAAGKGDVDIIELIGTGMSLITDAERREIEQHWIGVEVGPGVNLTWVWRGAGAIAVILLVIVVWNRRLRRDIIKRKHAEDALKSARDAASAAQSRLTDAIESVSEGFALFDQNDRLELSNSKYRDLYRYDDADSSVGTSLEELIQLDVQRGTIADDSDGKDVLLRRTKTYGETDEAFDIPLADGRWVQIRDRRTSEGGTVSIHADVTELKHIEADLAAKTAVAEEATRAKSRFLANMSHELRTPLSGITANLELLKLTELNERQSILTETADRASQSLLGVIGEVLDLSKIEAGKIDLEQIATRPRDLMDEVVTLMAPRIVEKGLRLNCSAADAVPDAFVSDPFRLRQVLLNLIGNAVKFTEAGGIYVRAELVHDESGRDSIRFEVHDTGIGIDPGRAEKLFEAFSQDDVSTTRRYGGTGLGLTIARGIVEMMGGEIHAESEPGLGSTFWLQIPVETNGSVRAAPKLAGEKVLAISSDSEFRKEVAAALRACRSNRQSISTPAQRFSLRPLTRTVVSPRSLWADRCPTLMPRRDGCLTCAMPTST